jgi:hypothetical protein
MLGAETEFLEAAPLRGWAAICVEHIGSLVNFLLGLLAVAAQSHASNQGKLFFQGLALSHFLWGAAQILPFLPFRAGRRIARGLRPSQRLLYGGASVVFSLVLSTLAERAQLTTLLPLITFNALAAATAMGRAAPDRWDERSGAEQLADTAELKRREGDLSSAIFLAECGLLSARSVTLRQRLWTTLGWAAIGEGNAPLARRAIGELTPDAIDYYLVAAYLCCANRLDDAEQLLREARDLGHRDRDTTKLMIEVLFRRGNLAAALALAHLDPLLLSIEDWRAIKDTIPNAKLGVPT